jgi:hypothetical protein
MGARGRTDASSRAIACVQAKSLKPEAQSPTVKYN